MKIIAITQARISSTRLPNKVLKKLGTKSVLDLHIKRIKKSTLVNEIVIATTNEPEAFKIQEIADSNNVGSYQGSLDDVLDRFYNAAKKASADIIIRLTSDCPLIDPEYIDDLVKKFLASNVDYASNCMNPTLPDGCDAEIFTFQSLESAWKDSKLKSEREHVTPYLRNSGLFKTLSVEYSHNWSHLRLTLDTQDDYELLNKVVSHCGEEADIATYVDFLESNPDIQKINSSQIRNEGYLKSLKGDSKC